MAPMVSPPKPSFAILSNSEGTGCKVTSKCSTNSWRHNLLWYGLMVQKYGKNHLEYKKPVVNNGILTISTGAGFLNHQQYGLTAILKDLYNYEKGEVVSGHETALFLQPDLAIEPNEFQAGLPKMVRFHFQLQITTRFCGNRNFFTCHI